MIPTDDNNQLIIPHPPPQPRSFHQVVIFYAVIPIFAPLFLSYKCITDSFFRNTLSSIYSVISYATANPITKGWYFQNKDLLHKLWNLPSAQAYVDQATGQPHLEYQVREGYCGSATQRCVLQSFGYQNIPLQKSGESKPEQWSDHVVQMASESSHGDADMGLTTKIVRGGVSYEEFLQTLRDGLANENCRIACNFLRPALVGFKGIRVFPVNFLLGVMGGHFSPILGMLEEDDVGVGSESKVDCPLVCVWDTNHAYNGAYFVPAKRMYEAVHAVDLMDHKHRALILVERKVTK
ncbi:predicted protein [Thalassiosira pseudonana CCMP1335]|uniref:Uncharacterized protein n=1 Tax=Thalassiosira pseudonana TaxID=35128 RepID=B8CA62_THAPS|nr:predicted protein [Thalassiosira pseudonana CCMP1335]EED89626.1 predicted protein [Thalassiosira pseudonana CCMP1335]